jgi:outer membrane protein W
MKKIILILFLLGQSFSFSQLNGERFSLFIGGDYITSAQIFLNPNSSDVIIRNQAFEITDLFSPVIDLRYSITDEILIGLSTEYISKNTKGYNQTVLEGSHLVKYEVDDGVTFIPIELSIYYYMPFSTENFSFIMGGGIGYYPGYHTRTLGDIKISNEKNNNSFGMLVSIGMEYRVFKQIGIQYNMKFRDPENKVTSRYKDSSFNYNGSPRTIDNTEFTTKINLNGISFLAGVVIHF